MDLGPCPRLKVIIANHDVAKEICLNPNNAERYINDCAFPRPVRRYYLDAHGGFLLFFRQTEDLLEHLQEVQGRWNANWFGGDSRVVIPDIGVEMTEIVIRDVNNSRPRSDFVTALTTHGIRPIGFIRRSRYHGRPSRTVRAKIPVEPAEGLVLHGLQIGAVVLDVEHARTESYLNPTRCRRCQRFGHQPRFCPHKYRCAVCAGPHQSRHCKNLVFACANCKSARDPNFATHSASSSDCPIFRRKRLALNRHASSEVQAKIQVDLQPSGDRQFSSWSAAASSNNPPARHSSAPRRVVQRASSHPHAQGPIMGTQQVPSRHTSSACGVSFVSPPTRSSLPMPPPYRGAHTDANLLAQTRNAQALLQSTLDKVLQAIQRLSDIVRCATECLAPSLASQVNFRNAHDDVQRTLSSAVDAAGQAATVLATNNPGTHSSSPDDVSWPESPSGVVSRSSTHPDSRRSPTNPHSVPSRRSDDSGRVSQAPYRSRGGRSSHESHNPSHAPAPTRQTDAEDLDSKRSESKFTPGGPTGAPNDDPSVPDGAAPPTQDPEPEAVPVVPAQVTFARRSGDRRRGRRGRGQSRQSARSKSRARSASRKRKSSCKTSPKPPNPDALGDSDHSMSDRSGAEREPKRPRAAPTDTTGPSPQSTDGSGQVSTPLASRGDWQGDLGQLVERPWSRLRSRGPAPSQ